MRPILASISTSALKHNLDIVKQRAQKAKVMAVVKANAYGHGLLHVAHALNEADGFATVSLSEAIDLREAGFEQDILLLEGAFSEEELKIAASFKISIVVHNVEQVQMLEKAKLARAINVYLKMNTGMNRLGFPPSSYLSIFHQVSTCDHVGDIVLMSHFAMADEEPGITKPLQTFKETVKGLTQAITLANSATILIHPEAHADWVRPGIMLYGATPISGTPAATFGLKPAMQLTSEIISIQTLSPGESAGYGAKFTAIKQARIGIVACGYADGYPRHAPNGTPIAVNGLLTKTLGRVSMDMLFCDLTDLPNVNVGASVELWGGTVPVDAVAEASGTVGYELLCAVAPRVPVKVVA